MPEAYIFLLQLNLANLNHLVPFELHLGHAKAQLHWSMTSFWKKQMQYAKVTSPYQIQIIFLNIWHYNRTFQVTITGLMGSHQLTLCRWTEMHPGHIILALSWNSSSSLNKHYGKQLWLQPITINQHNYVKNVFEIWRSNRMSLCAWAMASSLSSDAEMRPYKGHIWKTSQTGYSTIWYFFSSQQAFPERNIQK